MEPPRELGVEDLRKENFSLRLRNFHLEERLQALEAAPGTGVAPAPSTVDDEVLARKDGLLVEAGQEIERLRRELTTSSSSEYVVVDLRRRLSAWEALGERFASSSDPAALGAVLSEGSDREDVRGVWDALKSRDARINAAERGLEVARSDGEAATAGKMRELDSLLRRLERDLTALQAQNDEMRAALARPPLQYSEDDLDEPPQV